MAEGRHALESLQWEPAWISHLGCHHGCVKFLELEVSRPWIFGGTGHAFALNIHEELCPSGPTAWNTEPVDRLAANIGYLIEGVTGERSQRDFEAKQKIAWALVTGCIDTEVPCYGWELLMPEWYIITGYEEAGYYFSGPGADEAQMPLPREDLGCTEIGWLSVHCVVRCSPSPDDEVVSEAITFALDNAAGKHLMGGGYASGLAALELWATSLESGRASRFGAGYNGECWRECREMAVDFLHEAKQRLDREATLFDEAIAHYSAVRDALSLAVERVPFLPPDQIEARDTTVTDAECAAIIREAKAAEEQGTEALRKLGEALKD